MLEPPESIKKRVFEYFDVLRSQFKEEKFIFYVSPESDFVKAYLKDMAKKRAKRIKRFRRKFNHVPK